MGFIHAELGTRNGTALTEQRPPEDHCQSETGRVAEAASVIT